MGDGKIEPRALSKEDLVALAAQDNNNGKKSSSSPAAVSAPPGPAPVLSNNSFVYHKSNITSYAFLNEKKVVKLYITLKGIGDQCTDNDITLKHDETSLSLCIKNYKGDDNDNPDDPAAAPAPSCEDRTLSFGKLYGKITHAEYKLKPNKIIVTLTKSKEGVEWRTINDKGKSDVEEIDDLDDEYDGLDDDEVDV